MPKGSVEATRTATRAVLLRDRIRTLEVQAADLSGQSASAARELLALRDAVEDEAVALEEQGLDLRAERTRIKTVDNILVRKAARIESALAPTGGFQAARLEIEPAESRWWWFLDSYLAENRRKRATRFVIIVLVAGVLLIGGNWAMNHFFGMDPQQRAARTQLSEAEQQVGVGNYDAAIAAYQEAIAIQPDLAEAYIGLGVIYYLQGREADARQTLAKAEELIADRATYLLALSRGYSAVGEQDKALSAAEEAVTLAPESAQALLIRGGVYEAMGKRQEALADYERSGELAQASGEDALYVLSRMRMGMLLQSGSGGGASGAGF